MTYRIHARKFAAALFLTISVASFGLGEESSAAEIQIGTLKVASQTPVWVAQQQGIFAKHGLQATITYFGPSGVIGGLQSKAVDVGLSILGSGLMAISRDFNIVPIFQDEISQPQGPDTSGIHVLESSGIEDLKGLEGKKVAIGGLATQNTVAVQALLKKAGVDLDKVEFVEMPFPSMLTALQRGMIDAVNAVDPFTTQIRIAEGVDTLAYNYVETVPEQPLGVWFAHSDYLKENPEDVAAFTQALREAIEYMKADPERARTLVGEFTGISPEILNEMPLTNWSFEVRPEKWQAVIEMMQEEGLLPEERTVETFFSEQLQEYVVR